MKPDPIMEELWAVKDKLAREAGYDADRFVENLRRWETTHPHSGRVLRTPEELHQFVAEEERKHAVISNVALNEDPPRKD